jgi:hypothetical protein
VNSINDPIFRVIVNDYFDADGGLSVSVSVSVSLTSVTLHRCSSASW